jgi:orotate phosphoribosyltransferase
LSTLPSEPPSKSGPLRSEEHNPDERTPWLASLAEVPRYVLQPFSLSAVAVVGAIILGVFGLSWPALAALVAAILLLVIGLRGTPKEAVGALVGGSAYQPVSPINVATPVDHAGLTIGQGGELSPLEAICFLHLYLREGGSVGRTRTIAVDYFVDLMTAALVPGHLECLTHELADHIRRSGRLSGVTTAAVPKRGNALLVAATARELKLEPLFIKERPLFGKAIEGIGGRPKTAALIDDIASDGELLVRSVTVLRECGYQVSDAFVLIDRKEGDATESLAEQGVTLRSLCSLGDQELESIAAIGRRTAAV